ncbi:hypothetical protein HAX54_031895, partial [Datura stramonium]|nr:hypothetical protein [Datura stramonium]
LLGTPHVEPQPFVNIVKKSLYRDIKPTRCGPNSVASTRKACHVIKEIVCLFYALMTGMPINVGVIIKNILKTTRVKKGQNIGFRGLLNRFLRGHDIEEESYYRSSYDPRGVDVTKTKEPEGINSPVFSINERNTRIDNMLIHLYGMQMLQLRMNGVTEEKIQQLYMDYPLIKHS